MIVRSFSKGKWIEGNGKGQKLYDASTGEQIGQLASDRLDYQGMTEYARDVGGPNLRKMTIHERAYMIKDLARYLIARKQKFYELSPHTGATKSDSWIDIDGGISTLFVSSSKARREMPDEKFYVDGTMEQLSREGTFVGQHLFVPLEGVAVHINAFNFPVWGMLEKLGPTLIAGMPAIIKPSPVGSYLAEKVFAEILESEILPEGAIQFIAADVPGDLLDHLMSQDVVAFTGSRETGLKLKAHPNIIKNNIRFNLETDSLNCSILGPDVSPDMKEFDLFIDEVFNEMTVKAGQKCTAIRRALVPENRVEEVIQALSDHLDQLKIGSAQSKETQMGPLASRDELDRFHSKLDQLKKVTDVAYEIKQADFGDHLDGKSAFSSPVLLFCKQPFDTDVPHDVEAFGPVSTIMPYQDTQDAIALANKSNGSLVGSLFTADDDLAREITLGVAPYHGRFMIINKDCADESTGHGSPLPHLTHGGPGRAGGGEEMGGIRGILHYMQRIAIQGSPTTLSKICNTYLKGADKIETEIHPFRKYFEELRIGESITTHRRTVTEADIVNFGGISGDHFYAHFDDIAAKDSLFKERVAHGYFILSASAGLFVDPAPGPILANYGLEHLRFVEPVKIGDTIQAKLTVKRKIKRRKREKSEKPKGVVIWDVEVINQHDEAVALYDILTLVQRSKDD